MAVNFVKELANLELQNKENKFVLYLEEDIDWKLPANFEKKVFLPKLYKRDDLMRKLIWERRMLPKKVAEDECDVLLSLYQSATIVRPHPNPPLSKGRELKHFMFVHDVVWKIFPEYLNNLRKKIYYRQVEKAARKADQILTISQSAKKDIVKHLGIPEKKIRVLYLDCDEIFKKEINQARTEEVLRKYQLRENEPYIFYVGGLDTRKNVAGLIEAYGKFWQDSRGSHSGEFPNLAIAGKFYPHLVPLMTDVPGRIKETSNKYKLPEGMVKMIGFVDQEDLPYLYQNARLFCYPSLYEGFGIPLLEAQNVGCPVVTSNVSSIPEVVSNENAILIDPENADEIAGAMKKVLTDEGLRYNLVEKGKVNTQRFSWESFTKQVLEMVTGE